MFTPMTIGRLADAAGVNVETIRFYQRSGLIDEPVKPMRGYRSYQLADVRRIRFIKRAQLLGFTLEEIASLLKLEGTRTCAETHDLAARKLAMVKIKLADLTAMEKALTEMIMNCEIGSRTKGCPIIQALIED
jgi:MerR family mercuric resistance operon transcriptional regulator